MSRRTWVAFAAVALLLGAGIVTAVLVTPGGGAASGGGAVTPAPATAAVERGDLVDSLTVSGTLGYGPESLVVNSASGTLTASPAEGSLVRRGGELYEVDRDPVILMYGPKPMHRTLELGVGDGADVRHLEKNLRALGHDLTVDDHFSVATQAAVRAWQADAGLPVTGSVSKAQVVVLPGAVRVQAARVPAGAPVRPGQSVLAVTGVRRLVSVELDAERQSLAAKGEPVRVKLPGGAELAGKVGQVGAVAKKSGDEVTVDVRISLDDAGDAGALDQVPVSVELQSEVRRGVLSVPIEALLALREGGYGVEVVEGSAARVVPVTAGIFAGGRVEVSGGGLAAGMQVEVPAP
ncbi:peptidoglycan-binding protein [Nonomuraea typhae]|uniref:peptidoglycan-binding protein n=1 Tax=Nonomuraea typhae TaxID=2603600 RepID=UPI001FE557D9|nr:peptidoglycan-binding protein [Nonomuraea typhae]